MHTPLTLSPDFNAIPNGTAMNVHRIAVHKLKCRDFDGNHRSLRCTFFTYEKSWTGHCSPNKVLTIAASDE
jgi:hypothetical protein